jgi:hypothetical protein
MLDPVKKIGESPGSVCCRDVGHRIRLYDFSADWNGCVTPRLGPGSLVRLLKPRSSRRPLSLSVTQQRT